MSKIRIHSKKRTAVDADLDNPSLNQDNNNADPNDIATAAETGVLDKYEELPKDSNEDELKRLKKKEYQKKKLKKQRQSKKGFEIIAENTDLVQLVANDEVIDLTHHLGIQSAKSNEDLKQVKKKSRLQHTLMKDNEDNDVLVGFTPEITIQTKLENQLKLQHQQLQRPQQLERSKSPQNKNNTKDKKDKKAKKDKNVATQSPLPMVPQLTKRQQRKEGKKAAQKASGQSMVSNELSKQLELLSNIADRQEHWSSSRIEKENAKIQFFAEKEAKKVERKEKDKKIKELMLEQVRLKKAEEKRAKKEFAE